MKRILSHVSLCLLLAALPLLLAGCDRENDNESGNEPGKSGAPTLRVHATQLGFLEEDGKTRATTDTGTMKTTFEAGDAIGLFAVKDGTVQADCKNLKLTMQADGSWQGDDILYTPGCTYFAYSPYRNEANITAAKNTTDIYNNFTVNLDQSTAAKYAANDLMTTTTCEVNTGDKSLTLVFEHRLALVEMERAYCKGKGDLYMLNSAKACELHLTDYPSGKDNVLTGYHPSPTDAPDLVRFLLKPGNRSVAAVFERTDVLKSEDDRYLVWSNAGTTLTLDEGRRYKFKPYKKRDVKVGDYYYSDGSLYLKEWTNKGDTPPDINHGCIGVVYNTTMALNDQSGQWKNGYVFALKSLGAIPPIEWNPDDPSSYRTWWDTPYTTWGKVLSISLDYSNWNSIKLSNSITSGYDVCQVILSRGDASEFLAVYGAIDYANEVSLPTGQTSGWFLPSVWQWVQLYRGLGGYPNAFEASEDETFYNGDVDYGVNYCVDLVKGMPLISEEWNNGYFWTSTQANAGKCWMLSRISNSFIGGPNTNVFSIVDKNAISSRRYIFMF